MKALEQIRATKIGRHLLEDKEYRVVAKAVCSLILNLLFVFFNGILGFLSSSLIFVVSALYYLMLSSMRFCVVRPFQKGRSRNDRQTAAIIGIMLIILGIVLHIMVIISMKFATAAFYSTIPMITIATYTFCKIAVAVATAVKQWKSPSLFFGSINAIRYCEVAVSLLTMQQSMLVSFGDGSGLSSVILNACTGTGVCIFILALGITTFKNSRKE